jgi:integrase
VRKPAPPSGRERRLRSGEEKQLLPECDNHSNPMLGWIVRLALFTGMRLGEIVSLRLNQIDLKKRVVNLSITKNGMTRTVPLSKPATKVLKSAIAIVSRPSDTNLVFFGEPGKSGNRNRYRFEKQWSIIKRKLGLVDFRFHDMRHEAVSRFVESGLSDQEVAAISGHKSMQMVKRYTHLRAEDLVAKLDKPAVARKRIRTN